MRGALHGFRIPGGIVALAVAIPGVCGLLGLEWRRFGDRVVPLVALALIFVRLGCFLNGCCFGKASALPWAVAFPSGSWVFWYHSAHNWVPPGANESLAVHPLQLYFLLAAVAATVAVAWQPSDSARVERPLESTLRSDRGWFRLAGPQWAGRTQALFYALFFGSTAVLEPFRENYLTLNNWLAPAAAILASVMLVSGSLAHGKRPLPGQGRLRNRPWNLAQRSSPQSESELLSKRNGTQSR